MHRNYQGEALGPPHEGLNRTGTFVLGRMVTEKRVVPASKWGIARAFRKVDYITPEEAHAMIEDARYGWNGERDSLPLSVLWQTSLRTSEALSLTPSHIIMAGTRLWVRGKGAKDRVIALAPDLYTDLMSYARNQSISAERRFFNINRITGWRIVKLAARRAGIAKRIYPHLFRHGSAIEIIRKLGQPHALKVHLGHSTPVMTMRYLEQIQQEDAAEIISKARL